jgi:XTP/dITP diphosphohydrolase
LKEITLVTKNKQKINDITKLLKPFDIKVNISDISIDEIQAYTNEEIAINSAETAYKILNKDLIKMDSGLCIKALNNFPGPYAGYVEDTLKEDGILKLMHNIEDRSAYFIDAFALKQKDKEVVVFVNKTMGTISKEKLGTDGVGYDFIFIPDGYNQTLAEIKQEERHLVWNKEAYLKLAEYLTKQ